MKGKYNIEQKTVPTKFLWENSSHGKIDKVYFNESISYL